MTTHTDPYLILDLDRHATQVEISRAYRRLLRRFHPDTRPPTDRSGAAACDAALQQILAAYAILGDPDRRADYDQHNPPPPPLPAPGRLVFLPLTRLGNGPLGASRSAPLRAEPVRWTPRPRRFPRA